VPFLTLPGIDNRVLLFAPLGGCRERQHVWQILRVPLAVLVVLAGTMTLTVLWTRSEERLPEVDLPPRAGDWTCERIGPPGAGREHYLTAPSTWCVRAQNVH
jgi:hypothetical protein